MFVGRKEELAILEECYSSKKFQMVGLYGRRRVGKTELLREFSRDKNAIFFSAEESTEKINLDKFSETVSQFIFGASLSFKNWEDLLKSIHKKAEKEKVLLIIDEFPYLEMSSKGFLSVLQHSIDHLFKATDMMIVLCGSSISYMENEVIAHKSPIFGRFTEQIFLKPFDYYDASMLVKDRSVEEKIIIYSILGGIPLYYEFLDEGLDIRDNIKRNIMKSSRELYNAPNTILKQELRNPAKYMAIIETIAGGASKSNEIATGIGELASTTQQYLETLIRLHIVRRDKPAGGGKSRKTIYMLEDNLTNFVYRFGYRNNSLVDQGLVDYLYDEKIEPDLPAYVGRKFEQVCMQYLIRLNRRMELPFVVEEFGRFWGGNTKTKKEEEIDICGLSGDKAIYAECKYRNEKLGVDVIHDLIEKSQLLHRKEQHYYFFSKSGFTKDAVEYARNRQIVLVGIGDLFDF